MSRFLSFVSTWTQLMTFNYDKFETYLTEISKLEWSDSNQACAVHSSLIWFGITLINIRLFLWLCVQRYFCLFQVSFEVRATVSVRISQVPTKLVVEGLNLSYLVIHSVFRFRQTRAEETVWRDANSPSWRDKLVKESWLSVEEVPYRRDVNITFHVLDFWSNRTWSYL